MVWLLAELKTGPKTLFPTLTRIEAGTVRNLHGTPTGDTYKTKYTIAGILAYSGLIHDAVNEKGLQMNGLYYKPMTLPKAEKDSVSQLELGGYILAMYSECRGSGNSS